MPGKPPHVRERRPTPPTTGSGVKPPPGRVTLTRKVGAVSETWTGTVADLRALGLTPTKRKAKAKAKRP